MKKKKEYDIELLKEDIDSVKKEIDNIEELINVIDSVWQGKDKEKFLKEFSKKREELKKYLDNNYKKINNRI